MDWRGRIRSFTRPRKLPGTVILGVMAIRYVAWGIERLGDIQFVADNANSFRDVLLHPLFGLVAIAVGFAWLILVPDEQEVRKTGYIPLSNGFSISPHKGRREHEDNQWTIELALTIRNEDRRTARDTEIRLTRVDDLRETPDGIEYQPMAQVQPVKLQWALGDGGGAKCSIHHEATVIVALVKTWGDSHGAYTQIWTADESLRDEYRIDRSTLHFVTELSAEGRRPARFVIDVHAPGDFRGKEEPTVYFSYSDYYTTSEQGRG